MTPRPATDFRGVGVAVVTAFQPDGSIDIDGFRRHARRMIDGGVDYLVPCGSTGEAATMSSEEQRRVIEAAVAEADGRVPVVAGASSNATAEAILRTRAAEAAGADAILTVAPYYNKPPQQGLYEHFKNIAESTDLPIILYNVPGRTSSNILPETVLRLAEIPNVVAIKEASANFDQFGTLLAHRPEGFLVLSGDDELTLPMVALGADGLISVVANEAPVETTAMVHAALRGDFAAARLLHYRLLDLMRVNFVETNPIPAKTGVDMIFGDPARFRLPLVPMSEGGRTKLAAAIAAAAPTIPGATA